MLTLDPRMPPGTRYMAGGVDAFGCVTGIVGDLLPTPAAPNCRLSASARASLLAKPLSLRSSPQAAASFEPLLEPFGALYIFLRPKFRVPLSSALFESISPFVQSEAAPPTCSYVCACELRVARASSFHFPMSVCLSVTEVVPCTPGLELSLLSLLSRLCRAVW
jgi:hypothetical protein